LKPLKKTTAESECFEITFIERYEKFVFNKRIMVVVFRDQWRVHESSQALVTPLRSQYCNEDALQVS
jgi:hypothetical protein